MPASALAFSIQIAHENLNVHTYGEENMQMFEIPIIDGTFYLKFARILVTGPQSFLSGEFKGELVDGKIMHTLKQVRKLFLQATEGFEPDFVKEAMTFQILPPHQDESAGEYIQFDFASPKKSSLNVRFRLDMMTPTGKSSVTLNAFIINRAIEAAIHEQIVELYR